MRAVARASRRLIGAVVLALALVGTGAVPVLAGYRYP